MTVMTACITRGCGSVPAADFETIQPAYSDPMRNFDERDLLALAETVALKISTWT